MKVKITKKELHKAFNKHYGFKTEKHINLPKEIILKAELVEDCRVCAERLKNGFETKPVEEPTPIEVDKGIKEMAHQTSGEEPKKKTESLESFVAQQMRSSSASAVKKVQDGLDHINSKD